MSNPNPNLTEGKSPSEIQAEAIMMKAWGPVLPSVRSCTSQCYQNLHVDDLLGWYLDEPITGMDDPRATAWAEATLNSDTMGNAQVRLVIPVNKGNQTPEVVKNMARTWAMENNVPNNQVRLQWLKVWYFRERH